MDIGQLFPSKYLKAEDLQGRSVTVTMQAVKIEKMGQGTEKEDKAVLYFQGKQKGLILNRTNAMVITAMYGSETNHWGGKKVILYASTVRAFGKLQNVIRVKEGVPGASPAPIAPPEAEESFEDEDFTDGMEAADGEAMWATDEDLSPPRRRLLTNGLLCFGEDWDLAKPWLIRRHQKQFVRDHVVDDEASLSDDECDMIADYLEKNMEPVRQTWPQQKKLMTESKVAA